MINSKTEKLLLVLAWYIFLMAFRFILPVSEPPSNIDKNVVVLLSVMATIIIYRIYIYNINKYILKNINALLETNQLQEAIEYINKCLKKQKKSYSLYMYKLYVLAMCGRITEFEKMLSECERSNKYYSIITLDFVEGLKSIISYIKTGKCTIASFKERYWFEIVSLLSDENFEKIIPNLVQMYSIAKFGIIKTVLALRLYRIYLELNNEKSEYYYNEALKYAPSLEITYYIESVKLDI